MLPSLASLGSAADAGVIYSGTATSSYPPLRQPEGCLAVIFVLAKK